VVVWHEWTCINGHVHYWPSEPLACFTCFPPELRWGLGWRGQVQQYEVPEGRGEEA